MAYKITDKANTSAPNATYPYGNIKDDDGSGNGTALNMINHADFHQFFARLLALGGVTGNGLPENVTNGFQFHTALQAIIDASVVGLVDLKGDLDASSNPNYPAASKGDAYVITVAGKVGGASGKVVAVGDFLIAKANNAGGTEASVGTSWFVVEKNLDQATPSVAGIAKLYANLSASNTDGAPDQASVVAGIAAAAALLATIAQAGWTNFTLLNSWASGGITPQYFKDQFGCIHFRGNLNNVSASLVTFATLPAGSRPTVTFNKTIKQGSTPHNYTLTIDTSGNCTLTESGSLTDSTIYIDDVNFWSI